MRWEFVVVVRERKREAKERREREITLSIFN